MKEIAFTPQAEEDVKEAYEWYKEQKAGLGDDFMLCLEAVLKSMKRNSGIYQRIHKEARRAVLRRFPYNVIYTIEEDEIVVHAVFHARRDPRKFLYRV